MKKSSDLEKGGNMVTQKQRKTHITNDNGTMIVCILLPSRLRWSVWGAFRNKQKQLPRNYT